MPQIYQPNLARKGVKVAEDRSPGFVLERALDEFEQRRLSTTGPKSANLVVEMWQSAPHRSGCYIIRPPELVVEVAASSTAIDTHEKRDSYAACGVRKYVLWRTIDQQIDRR